MKKARNLVGKVVPAIEAEFEAANRENAELIVDVAKVLVPIRTGKTRSLIRNVPNGSGGQIIDFGPLSKILEGGTAPRFHRSGKSTGSAPASPFVNPAMKGTKKKRNARNRKAVKAGIRIAKGG